MKTKIIGYILLMCFLGCKKTSNLQTNELNSSVETKENLIKNRTNLSFLFLY